MYTIASNIKIPSLGITGPVTTLTQLTREEVDMLVRKGAEIYEHNPVYPKEKELVTTRNVMTIRFEKTRKDAILERKQDLNGRPQEVEVVHKQEVPAENNNYSSKKKDRHRNRHNNNTPEEQPKVLAADDFSQQ